MFEDPVWEVATAPLERGRAPEHNIPEKARQLLANGWEPFAVSEACMWFRLKST